ncbi:MAG: SlyX family protein [Alphaproteobacteria bacterium]|nr:SlyX family protein [Alphaproteobacteria bacterium]
MSEMESRLIDLECRVAYHELAAEEMSSVIVEQGRAIDLLSLQVRRLTERLRDMEATWSPPSQDERPPPHY